VRYYDCLFQVHAVAAAAAGVTGEASEVGRGKREGISEGVMAFCTGVALGKGQSAVGFAGAC